jgi:hypothetical protein
MGTSYAVTNYIPVEYYLAMVDEGKIYKLRGMIRLDLFYSRFAPKGGNI